MATNLRGRVAAALAWTSDQIESGRGKWQVRIMSLYLDEIQKHLGRRIPDALPRYAVSVELPEEDPGSSEVVVGKKHGALFALTEDAFLLSRDAGWGRTHTQGVGLEGCRAEAVTCT